MKIMCENSKHVIASHAIKFDRLIVAGNECEVEWIVRDFNCNNDAFAAKGQALTEVFFIWIGCIKPEALEYIDIWQAAVAESGTVRIYYDSHFLLFNCYAKKFTKLYGVTEDTPKERIIEWQDDFKRKVDAFVRCGDSFDQAFIHATRALSRSAAWALENELILARESVAALKQDYALVDIRNEIDVFYERFFYDAYYRELTLRANAAAAADILRMLILYKHGGVFIDVDTLPSLLAVYGPVSDLANCNIQNVVRSEYYLRRLREIKNSGADKNSDMSVYECYLDERDPRLLAHIKRCSSLWDGRPLSFEKVAVHDDLLSIAALETLCEYNNNILAAVKKSRLVKVILREIKRRYTFISRNGLDTKPNDSIQTSHYLYRLSNYRYDAMDDKDNVTLCLTGPILVLEVMLGVAYEILSLDKSVSALALSYALRLNCISVAFSAHTCYTPEHMKSSWR